MFREEYKERQAFSIVLWGTVISAEGFFEYEKSIVAVSRFCQGQRGNIFVTKIEGNLVIIIAVRMDRKDCISERWCRKSQKTAVT